MEGKFSHLNHPRIVHLCNVKKVSPLNRLNYKALIYLFYLFVSWFPNNDIAPIVMLTCFHSLSCYCSSAELNCKAPASICASLFVSVGSICLYTLTLSSICVGCLTIYASIFSFANRSATPIRSVSLRSSTLF